MRSLAYSLVIGAVSMFSASQCDAKLLDGALSYTPPTTALPPEGTTPNRRDFDASFDTTWRAVVSHLSDTAFVIDTIDKSSGLIAISFSLPDPKADVDCGVVSSWVKNLRGRRDYQFDGASPNESYELVNNSTLVRVERHFEVSGKMNIFVTEQTPKSSRVKIVARYIANITATATPLAFDLNFQRVPPNTITETMSFNTGQDGKFPAVATTCRPRGTLESKMLDAIAAAIVKK